MGRQKMTINRKRMPTRVCAACDAHSLPRVGGVHVCPALLFLHSCGRSAEGDGGAGRAEHNAAKEAINLNTLNQAKPPQSPLTASLQPRVRGSLSDRHTTRRQCCLTVGSESTTSGKVRQAGRVRKQESPRLVLKQRRGRVGLLVFLVCAFAHA